MSYNPFRNYDTWLSTDREGERWDELCEKYSDEYDTPEYHKKLEQQVIDLFYRLPQTLEYKMRETVNSWRTQDADLRQLSEMYKEFGVAPSLDEFAEQYDGRE